MLVSVNFGSFFTEQVFTLPLYCYEQSNHGAQEFSQKSAKRTQPCEPECYTVLFAHWCLLKGQATGVVFTGLADSWNYLSTEMMNFQKKKNTNKVVLRQHVMPDVNIV